MARGMATMKDLKRFSPIRRSLQFEQMAQDDSGEFFERHFSELFVEIHTLVSSAFCPNGDEETDVATFSPWLQKHRDEFLQYVQVIARPDFLSQQWGSLLRDNTERTCLLQGVMMKVLDTHVFSSLLFGADAEHLSILESIDVSMIHAEGASGYDCLNLS